MHVLNKVYVEENVINNLSLTFNTVFKRDWVGRIYTVFNPNLKDGKFDPNNPIYTYNEQGLSTEQFIRQYILTKLSAVDQFITARNLFELVTYELKELDKYDNYLFVIKPLPYDDMIKYAKLLWIPIIIISVIVIGMVMMF